MRIEVWSDIACPFCYIGKRRLEEALAHFPGKTEVEVVYRSFELDSHAPRSVEYDVHDMLSRKYGMSREHAVANNRNLAAQARELGIAFNFDTLKLTNTFDAHRLSHLAAKQGLMGEMIDQLYKAYFTDGLLLGDHAVLVQLAEEVGLAREEVEAALAGDAFSDAVRSDQQEAAMFGIRGVPYFILNRKYAVSGAQPVDVFRQALDQAWRDEHPLTVVGDDGAVCEDGVCTPPEKK